MRLYTAAHLLWLATIAVTAFGLSWLSRNGRISQKWLRVGLALFMVGGELQRYFKDGMAFPDRMPLHLCNISTWCAVLACLTLSPLAAEFAYFEGLAGAGLAMLSPDMGSEWNTRFFINHGGLIVAVVVLFGGKIMTMRRRGMWNAYGMLAAYVAVMGTYNWAFHTNFGYLAQKPEQKTLFDLMGPWPFYILSLGLFGLGIFWLLNLPVRTRQPAIRGEESRAAAASAAGTAATSLPQS